MKSLIKWYSSLFNVCLNILTYPFKMNESNKIYIYVEQTIIRRFSFYFIENMRWNSALCLYIWYFHRNIALQKLTFMIRISFIRLNWMSLGNENEEEICTGTDFTRLEHKINEMRTNIFWNRMKTTRKINVYLFFWYTNGKRKSVKLGWWINIGKDLARTNRKKAKAKTMALARVTMCYMLHTSNISFFFVTWLVWFNMNIWTSVGIIDFHDKSDGLFFAPFFSLGIRKSMHF